MRRNVGRHANGDTTGAVQQQVGNAGGQHDGFLQRAVEVVHKVNRVFVNVGEHFHGDGREPRFGITHSGGRIPVNRTEVALPIHQWVAHGKILREARHGVVHGAVAVGVVFPQHFPDDTGALFVGLVGAQAHIEHGVEDAPMDGFQPVAHIGQGAADNHAHGIVEVSAAHFVFDINLLNASCKTCLSHRMRPSSEGLLCVFSQLF